MIYGSILVLCLISILWILSKKQFRPLEFMMEKKEHPLILFYPCVQFLIHRFRYEGHVKKEDQPLLYRKLAGVMFGIVIVSALLFIFGVSQLLKVSEIMNGSILRPKSGQDKKTIEAVYKAGDQSGEMEIVVEKRVLSKEEREVLFSQCFEYLEPILRGENTSLEYVTSNLTFIREIPDANVTVSYRISSPEYLNSDGVVLFENLPEEGATVVLTVSLSYENSTEKKEYEVHIMPHQSDHSLNMNALLVQELAKQQEATAQEESLHLPSQVQGITVSWKEKASSSGILLLLLGTAAILFIPFLIDQKEKEKKQKQNDQMIVDYPEIVCKFTLLLKAGMTTRAAWERIVSDYIRKAELVKKNERVNYNRYAYDQMLMTRRELELGVTEEKAYEGFGMRCHMLPYLRFSTVIVQNLKKGSRSIAQILEQEAIQAFEERKEHAKQMGEKASAKLLGPTLGMLLIVLCIILVPAFLSF